MSKGLQQHKTADMIKWIITLLVGLALVGAVIGLAVKLNRQTTTTTLGGEAYSIGTLTDDAGEYAKGDTAIYTRKAIKTDGLKVVPDKDAKITYRLFFYDKDGKFISATEASSAKFNGDIPTGAESVKIMITPTEDEDGKVSLVEVLGYANQLTVTVNR